MYRYPPSVPGSETSEAAAASMVGKTGFLYRMIIEALVKAGATGRTCDELEIELGLRHQTCSPRIRELCQSGAVEATSQKRMTRANRHAVVNIATGRPMGPIVKPKGTKAQLKEALAEIEELEEVLSSQYEEIERLRGLLKTMNAMNDVLVAKIRTLEKGQQ
jgi:DNA-binding Lrp family transcriptional regulator